jgi:hypothetical protein
LLDSHTAEGELVRLSEILKPLNGRLPVIPGRFSRRLARLPSTLTNTATFLKPRRYLPDGLPPPQVHSQNARRLR